MLPVPQSCELEATNIYYYPCTVTATLQKTALFRPIEFMRMNVHSFTGQ